MSGSHHHEHHHRHAHAGAPPHDHGHGHDHGHAHVAGSAAQPARPAFSLLALSVWERLAGAAALSGALWLAVWWALR